MEKAMHKRKKTRIMHATVIVIAVVSRSLGNAASNVRITPCWLRDHVCIRLGNRENTDTGRTKPFLQYYQFHKARSFSKHD